MSDSKVIYYNVPIELWRGFLDNPSDVLSNVTRYFAAKNYANVEEAETGMGMTFHNKEKSWKEGVKLLQGNYSGVLFSIAKNVYWNIYNEPKEEYRLLLLLAYLAINSMSGHREINITSTKAMFCRMAGYVREQDIPRDRKGIPNIGIISKYMKNARSMNYHGEKIRLELMTMYKNLHFYSEKGKRGFAFMKTTDYTREECWRMMSEGLSERTKTYQRNAIKEQMRKAKEVDF